MRIKNIKVSPFGIEIKKKLAERRMTQVELAEKLGIPTRYLYLIIQGTRLNSKYNERIAKYLGIDMRKIG